VLPSAIVLLAHMKSLNKLPARYDLTRLVLKTFTFSTGSQSLSIDNAVLGTLTMVKNQKFLGSASTSPYNFGHFGLSHFVT